MEFWRKHRVLIGVAFVLAVLYGVGRLSKIEEAKSRPLNELSRLVPSEVVKVHVEVTDDDVRRYSVQRRDGRERVYIVPAEMSEALSSKIEGLGVSLTVTERLNWIDKVLGYVPILIMFGYLWSMRKGSKKPIDQGKRPGVTFADVGGYTEVKEELRELVLHLKHPERLRSMGGRTPKGVLLAGPPGTGKTLFARAVAGEAGVPFFTMAGSEFVEMFVGVGASRVRDLFESAKKHAPCIIFIDELDAIGSHRNPDAIMGDKERDTTLNQLLTEMDGFSQEDGIVIIGATNHPDALDAALLRPGRFDRRVDMTLPDLATRHDILTASIKARQAHVDASVDIGAVARSTPGFSGAALDNLVNEAALSAVRVGSEWITSEHFDRARDRVVMGLRQARVMSDEERLLVARHEAGHVIVALYTEGAVPVGKVTIVAHGGALGMMVHASTEDQHVLNRKQLIASMAVALGGRVAEEVLAGNDQVSNGAADDLGRVTTVAINMATRWGFGGRGKPAPLRVFALEGYELSGQRAEEVEATIEELIKEAGDIARNVIQGHRKEHMALVDALLERETLTGDEIRELLRSQAE